MEALIAQLKEAACLTILVGNQNILRFALMIAFRVMCYHVLQEKSK